MRVLLVNKYHYLRGGAERAYFDMGKMLEEAGHQVAYFSMEHPKNVPSPFAKYFVSRAEYRDEPLSLREKLRLGLRIIYNFEAKKKIAGIIRDFQPDLVHVHNIYHQLSPSIFDAIKEADLPLVMTLHDYKVVSPNYNLFVRGKIWEHTGGWRCIMNRAVHDSLPRSVICAAETWWHRFLRSYEHVDRFVSPSLFLREKYHALGFKREIVHIPNALLGDAEQALVGERDPELFLFFGRLSPEKGVDQVLRAWTKVHPLYRLKIVGEGPAKVALGELARELGISERVEFTGPLYGAALEQAKSQAQAIIVPSRWYENMPYTLLESLQAGAVVLVSRLGGMSERIHHEENGFLFDSEDPDALAELINSLASKDLQVIRKNARLSVQDLVPEKILPRLLSLYAELVTERINKVN